MLSSISFSVSAAVDCQHKGKGNKLRRHDPYDLQFIRAVLRNHMQHIGGNGIIQKMVAKSRPYISCHMVKQSPFDPHNARKDHIADPHQDGCGK